MKDLWGLPGGAVSCQHRGRKRRGFYPWVGRISWRKKWQPVPSILVWKIPWAEEPAGLQSMRSQRFRHNLGNVQLWRAGSSSLARNRTQALCVSSANGPPGKSPYLIFKWMMVDIKSILYVYFIGYIYDMDIIVLFLNVKICNVQKLHLLYLFNTWWTTPENSIMPLSSQSPSPTALWVSMP